MATGRLTTRAGEAPNRVQPSMQLTKLHSALRLVRRQRNAWPKSPIAALTLPLKRADGLAAIPFALGGAYPSHQPTIALQNLLASAAGCQSRRAVAIAAVSKSSRTCSKISSDAEGGGGSSNCTGGNRSSTAWPPPLVEWLRNHGGTVNGVELCSVRLPSGMVDRQLRATVDHPAGALLISVPVMLQIRYDNVEKAAAAASNAGASAAVDTTATSDASPLAIPAADAAALMALYDMMPRGSDTGAAAWPFKQALTLLYHLSRGPNSPLLPYLANLPCLAPGVPTPRVAMLMCDDAVDEMQYGNIIRDVRNQKYWLRHVSTEVLGRRRAEEADALAATFGGLLESRVEDLFGWAVAVAMSRCFGLTRFRTHTCVPLIDMANHVAPYSASNCEIRTGPGGEVGMYAKRLVQVGEELTLTYGTHDNHNLLLSYGFTLQPNPNDAFYFDMDLTTLESLIEGLVEGNSSSDGGGAPLLAPWQLDLLERKLGLRRPDEQGSSSSNGGSSNGAIRMYLSATLPANGGTKMQQGVTEGSREDMAAAVACDVEAAALDSATTAATVAATAVTMAAAAEGTFKAVSMGVRQPVDPRLLAALRIATLQDKAWHQILSPLNVDQIGGWGNLLARQQEITIMRLLAALVTALYTTFPTTIQQDRQLLSTASAAAEVGMSASSAAAATFSGFISKHQPEDAASNGTTPNTHTHTTANNSAAGRGGVDCWTLRPGPLDGMVGGPLLVHARDVTEAVRFRLGLKTTLERCLQALVTRAKELDELQKVR